MNRTGVIAVVAVTLTMAAAGCGRPSADGSGNAGSAVGGSSGGAAAGMCAQDQPDCIDTPLPGSDEPVRIDETGIEQFRRDAKFYLGRSKDEVPDLIRIARIDDEQFAMTEDYQVGRITVQLDDVEGKGTPIVTSATVELPDGPETFELEQ